VQVYQARVAACEKIADALYEIALELPGEAFAEYAPGKCAHVKVPGDGGHLLRRPISVYSVRDGLLHLAIQPKGEGTRRIVESLTGDRLDIIFPFGRGFDADGAERVWLVGGGVGVAPMRGCAEGFAGKVERAYFGFRSANHRYGVEACEAAGTAVTVCTDDGSAGVRGLVTERLLGDLEADKPDLIMACGPTPMLRAVQAIGRKHGIRTQLSLEQRMGCGIGACLTCSCAATSGGYLRVCADGPVFDGEAVLL
jgi:dihydroorotate dehydrogenase electron transfer subunit